MAGGCWEAGEWKCALLHRDNTMIGVIAPCLWRRYLLLQMELCRCNLHVYLGDKQAVGG